MRILGVGLVALLLSACIIQQQPAYQPQAAAQPQIQPRQGAALPPASERQLAFNGHAATAADLALLEQLEQSWGARLPSGAYWYDTMSGAAGPWGGPTGGFIQAGLALGGTLPANASGGGDGSLTNVFINGRELHPVDVQTLQETIGDVYEGRWFVDSYGNFGQEGGPVLGNLFELAKQQGGGADSYYRNDSNGAVFVGGGCVTVDSKNSSGEITSSYYSAGC